jgi:thiosulfate/3-mercaptopyruvate sulfurtransferase
VVHVGDAAGYLQGHVPGAVLVEPGELIGGAPPATGRLPSRERLEALFSRIGFDPDREVIVYDDEGGGWAGRMAWTLDVVGHTRWTYLNGGIHSWLAAGLPVETGPGLPVPPANITIDIQGEPIAELEDVMGAIEDDDQVVWDVRSREEYLGLRSGSRRAGHVPGAVNVDWMHLKDPERDLRLVDDVRSLLESRGIVPGKRIITHCQTHHRSGLSYMVARLLGYPRICAYHGSWAEWGNRDDTPVSRS